MSFVAYGQLAGTSFSFADARALRTSIVSTSDTEGLPTDNGSAVQQNGDATLVVHPYLGYIQGPGDKWVTDDHGIFYGTKELITAADPGKVIVGVFGGSLAEQFSAQGMDAFRQSIARNPRFQDKEIVVVPVTFAGYKQPQQLIALNYLLSLGAHFDLIVNIDGFNEVALSTAVNKPKNVSPFFPSSWGSLVGGLPNVSTMRLIGKTVGLRDLRRSWASAFQGALGSSAVTPNVLWLAGDRLLASSLAKTEREMVTEETDTGDTLALGPSVGTTNDLDLLKSLAESWKRSSQQMHEVAKAQGIPYFHFLQPNQYVPATKPMSLAEARTALNSQSPYKPWVEAGYPLLRTAGQELQASGVRFTDLSTVFARIQQPAYADDCCHLNQDGYSILGLEIGKDIAESLTEKVATQ